MDFILGIYHEIFYRPLLNGLVFLTDVLPYHDLGLAVILLTVFARGLLFPFTHHSVKAQVKMRALEPHIQKIRDEHKDNQEEQGRKIMALYKEHGVNPFSGCLMLLIQFPFLIALYQVFVHGLVGDFTSSLYSFVSRPETLRTEFLWFIQLTEPNAVLAILAGLTQFIQMKLAAPPATSASAQAPQKNDISSMMTTQMTYVMPIIIVVIGFQFVSAVALYWTTMNIFAIIHEMIVRRKALRMSDQK